MKALSLGLISLFTWAPLARADVKPGQLDEVGVEATVTVAQARFRRALELYQEGNLDAARAELHRAYDASPNFRVLYNLGQVQFELHDYPEALATFRKYLHDGGPRIGAARRLQVAADIDRLESRVAVLEIRANVPDVEVAIDDVSIGVAPLADVVVGAGRRKIVASRSGYLAETHWLDVAGGDHPTVDFAMREIVVAVRPELTPDEVTRSSRRTVPAPRRADTAPVPWIGWAIAGTLASGAVATGAFALFASRDLEQERATFGVERSELDGHKRRVDRLAIATDVLIGTAAVTGALSFYLTVARAPKVEGNLPRVTFGLRSVALNSSF
jgi:hypothetical protein